MNHSISLDQWEQKILDVINQAKDPFVIAIDGDAASGKTTCANRFKDDPQIWVISMDHFYLPFDQRVDEVGGHIDYEKLINSILIPHEKRETMHYHWYDPHTSCVINEYDLTYRPIILLEGAYSCHPKLRPWIHLSALFMIDKDLQKNRIIHRSNLSTYETFRDVWIPKEKDYQQKTNLDHYVNDHVQITE